MENVPADSRLLVADILGGNHAAFETLIGRYQKLVSHVVFRMVSDPADREDLCQDVFIRVYRNLAGFRFNCKLSTWIARVAYNACVNHVQKKRVALWDDLYETEESAGFLEHCPGEGITPDRYAEVEDLRARVRREIGQLPPLLGVIITLYHLEDMAYDEVAQVLDMPLGTVKSYLFRARQQLRERLSRKYQPEEICQ